jgi:hypothetical protein
VNLGTNVGPSGADELPRGQWRHIELVLRANSAGQADGEVHA